MKTRVGFIFLTTGWCWSFVLTLMLIIDQTWDFITGFSYHPCPLLHFWPQAFRRRCQEIWVGIASFGSRWTGWTRKKTAPRWNIVWKLKQKAGKIKQPWNKKHHETSWNTWMPNGWQRLPPKELYMYFVFLDVKGDRALLRMVSRQLLQQLEVSAGSLAANLSLTGPWAAAAQQMLANGMGAKLLQRRHRQVGVEFLEPEKSGKRQSFGKIWDGSGIGPFSWCVYHILHLKMSGLRMFASNLRTQRVGWTKIPQGCHTQKSNRVWVS